MLKSDIQYIIDVKHKQKELLNFGRQFNNNSYNISIDLSNIEFNYDNIIISFICNKQTVKKYNINIEEDKIIQIPIYYVFSRVCDDVVTINLKGFNHDNLVFDYNVNGIFEKGSLDPFENIVLKREQNINIKSLNDNNTAYFISDEEKLKCRNSVHNKQFFQYSNDLINNEYNVIFCFKRGDIKYYTLGNYNEETNSFIGKLPHVKTCERYIATVLILKGSISHNDSEYEFFQSNDIAIVF